MPARNQPRMAQVSGLRAGYDVKRPIGSRLLELQVGGKPVEDDKLYKVTTNSFLAEGGDGYLAFKRGREIARDVQLSEIVFDDLKARKKIEPPPPGRLIRA
jgi:2',3'-cyclic-nucleotide 2'-phosphodiesterase (5'-nucleotidase family)